MAAALEVENGVIKAVRIALGGVAHKPWRAFKAEQYLIGKTADEGTLRQAAALELEEAKPFQHNGFKIELAKRTIVSVLTELSTQGAA